MSEETPAVIERICRTHEYDQTRRLDIARAVQPRLGFVSPEAMTVIAREMSMPRVEVEALVSFYAVLTRKPQGVIVIRLYDYVVGRMFGY